MHRVPDRLCAVVPVILTGLYLLGGCAASKPPTPDPEVKPTLDTSWTLVPLRAKGPATADQGVTSYHNHLASIIERELARRGQTAVLYRGDGGSDTTGVRPDRLYRSTEGEESRPLDYEALNKIARTTGTQYVLLVQAVRWDRSLFADGGEAFVGFSPTGGLTVGLGTGSTKGLSVNLALVDVSEERTVWQRGRRFTGMLESTVNPFGTDERTIELYARSMILELTTGRELSPKSFTLETNNDVIAYRYGKPSVAGRSARVDEGEIIVEKQDGNTVRYPIETVSSIKSTTQNERIFPATEVR